MTVAAKKLVEQFFALPEADRGQVYQLITDSYSHGAETVSQAEWDASWKDELEKRIAEMESGEDPGVPLDVILADLEKPIRNT